MIRLLAIIGLAVAAVWLVAAAVLFLLPYVLGFIAIVFMIGVVKSALGVGDKNSGRLEGIGDS